MFEIHFNRMVTQFNKQDFVTSSWSLIRIQKHVVKNICNKAQGALLLKYGKSKNISLFSLIAIWLHKQKSHENLSKSLEYKMLINTYWSEEFCTTSLIFLNILNLRVS